VSHRPSHDRAGTRSWPVVVLAAVAVVAAAVAIALPQPSPGPARPPAVQLHTPLLSLRRVPGLLARTVGALRLGRSLDAALTDPKLGGGTQSSCLLVQQGGTAIYALRPTQQLIPASNLKLLTATAALDRLGPAEHLVTDVKADRPPAGGTVAGNLYLVGGGDPLLRTADYVTTLLYREIVYNHFEDLAAKVQAAGVTHITGGVVGDESRYDSERYLPTWKPSYAATGEVGPLSALQVNDGFQSFRPSDVGAAQPAVQAATLFASLLAQHGVVVDGHPAQGTTPAGAPTVASMPSLPMVDTLAEVLRQSDNNGAELITKELGRRFGQGPTTVAGVGVIRAALQADGLPVDQLTAVDGSGLDRSDRASCRLVLDTLLRDGPHGPLSAGLSVAGQSGTLEKRMVGTVAVGRLRAKTGSLEGVSALSGFVDPAAGGVGAGGAAGGVPPALGFSLIVNGLPSRAVGEGLEDRISLLLAQYPQAPAPDQLGPLPAS
jgi:D-alanyl-D-alanine carboxypeptidase/D-alanyl-D-alanine-endopeptidase (penicillin-binding protein 4)